MSELTRVSETPRVTELEDGTKVYRTAQCRPRAVTASAAA